MLNDYKQHCRPIRILSDDAKTGSRLGGLPPEGIVPQRIISCTQYFGTFVIDENEGTEISLFNAFEQGVFTERSFFRNRNLLFPSDQAAFIEFVVHGKSERKRRNSNLAAALSSHSLALDPEEPDTDGWLDSDVYQGSKIGGYPFYWQNKKSIREQGGALLAQGFTHLFQFASPDNRDARVSGDWPYGEFILNVFVDNPSHPMDIRYGWG
jgi:hypothetical protein